MKRELFAEYYESKPNKKGLYSLIKRTKKLVTESVYHRYYNIVFIRNTQNKGLDCCWWF